MKAHLILVLALSMAILKGQNDDFVNAIDLTNEELPLTYFNAQTGTAEPSEPPHAGSPATYSTWYTIHSSSSTVYSIQEYLHVLNSPVRVAVYHGATLNSLSLIAETTFSDFSDILFFQAEPGQTIYIALDSIGSDYFNLKSYPNGGSDDQAIPEILPSTLPLRAEGNNIFATAAPSDEDIGENLPATSTVWWSWTSPTSGPVRIDIRDSESFPSAIVYEVPASGPPVEVATAFRAAGFVTTAGTEYLIRFDEANHGPGDLEFYLHPFPNTPPANDDLANARDLGNGSIVCDGEWTFFATAEEGNPNEEIFDWGPSAIFHEATVWWTWTCPETGFYDIATYNSDDFPGGTHGLIVYTGPASSLTPFLYANGEWNPRATFTAGSTYWIQYNAGAYSPYARVELSIYPSHTPTPYFEAMNEQSFRLLGADRHPYADPDLDGFFNSIELACFTNPEEDSSGNEHLPHTEMISGQLHLVWVDTDSRYTQNIPGLPLELVPETTTDFSTWQTAPIIDGGSEYRTPIPNSPTNGFGRLRFKDPNLVLPPP